MKFLEIYAGTKALTRLEQNGFSQSQFDIMLGASGGPKWFVLWGLDKFIFGDFFADRTKPLHTIGSSAGAFRFACFGQKDPVAAINRLAEIYSTTTYSKKATSKEITLKAVEMLDGILAGNAIDEIIDNPIVQTHFVVAKTLDGLVAKNNKLAQMAGLSLSYALNRIDRKHLNKQYHRYVFHSKQSRLQISDDYNIPTTYVEFTQDNLFKSLQASGAIPIVIDGVEDIAGTDGGMYRDGGIIDYHFDLGLTLSREKEQGLTLYPHFSAAPKPGWFDKSLKRRINPKNYENVVMLVPSREFIKSLPNQKIPDRKDFENIAAPERIKMWQQVLSKSEVLAEEFKHFLENQDLSKIKQIG